MKNHNEQTLSKKKKKNVEKTAKLKKIYLKRKRCIKGNHYEERSLEKIDGDDIKKINLGR